MKKNHLMDNIKANDAKYTPEKVDELMRELCGFAFALNLEGYTNPEIATKLNREFSDIGMTFSPDDAKTLEYVETIRYGLCGM